MILPIISFILVLLKYKFDPVKFIIIIHLWLLISILTTSLFSPRILMAIFNDIPAWIYLIVILLSSLMYMVLWKKYWTYYMISALLQDFSMILLGYYLLNILNVSLPLMLSAAAIPYLIAHIEKIHKDEMRKLPFLLIFGVIVWILIFLKIPWYIFIFHIIGWTYLIRKWYILKEIISA